MSKVPEKHRVLFIDSTHPLLFEILCDAGLECDYRPEITAGSVKNTIHLYDGIIIRSKFALDREVLANALRLKFIGRVGSGLENIDLEYAKSRNISCFNSPEGHCRATGEHAAGMLIALLNNICKANNEVKSGQWFREVNRGVELRGKTVGIIGYGHTGKSFARCLSGFGATIIAWDKYKTGYTDEYVTESEMNDLFENCDILSINVPLTGETKYLVDNAFLQKFRKDIYLVNIARGKIINTSDLVANLKSGKVRGAALDVLEYEKSSFEELHRTDLPDDYLFLLEHQRVILTPHIAGWTHESNKRLAEVLARKILGYLGLSGREITAGNQEVPQA
jgi:D-3-phosphoglycerate dehydrogenase / 2-oxoglutarate reductase